MSEIDAMKSVEGVLEPLEESARKRVLDWAYARYIGHPAIAAEGSRSHADSNTKRKESAKKSSGTKKKKAKYMPRIVKELNLSPKDKQSGKEFAEEKGPIKQREI